MAHGIRKVKETRAPCRRAPAQRFGVGEAPPSATPRCRQQMDQEQVAWDSLHYWRTCGGSQPASSQVGTAVRLRSMVIHGKDGVGGSIPPEGSTTKPQLRPGPAP